MSSEGKCRVFAPSDLTEYRADPERRAELLVLDELARQLPAPWMVFYDVAWLAPVSEQVPKDGQTDFVLVHPDRGILLIEVKGGAILFDGTQKQWFSKNKDGEFSIDPIGQVKRSKYALLNKLKSVPALEGLHIRIFHAAAFPDVQVPRVTPIDAPKEILIGNDDFQYLLEKIEGIFDFWDPGSTSYDSGELVSRHLVDLLSRSVVFPNPLSIHTNRAEQEILTLTQEQYKILDLLNRNRRVAIGGCAGSGKTYLAVEKARRLADEGYKTLLTCFNRPLAEHLKELAHTSPLLEVKNFHSLCWEAAASIGVELPVFAKGTDCSGHDEKYAEVLEQAMKQNPSLRYDAILVDEGQDFKYHWWSSIESCMTTPQGILYIFYDDNQTLYDGRGTLPSGMTEIFLSENIRNAKPIFDEVARFYNNVEGVLMTSKGPTGSQVERHSYSTDEDLQRQISKTLSRLIVNEHIPASDVVVLTPKRLDRSALLKGKLPGAVQLVAHTQERGKNEVTCSTIHSFKGLERKVVLIAELDEEFANYKASDMATRCYVGFSRAKMHLELFGKTGVLDEIISLGVG